MTTSESYQLKWHSHSTHLNSSVAALLRSERFTDVVLCTLDGSQIPAHKFVLGSCSAYFSSLFDGQRSITRMGGMIYVVLPSEVSTGALKTLVEYMYKGETTVSNEILDTVLKAGETLKIRGLWKQGDEIVGDLVPAENNTQLIPGCINNQPARKIEELPKITMKKDDKIIKAFSSSVHSSSGLQRSMFIHGPPKLVFIKTADGTTQPASLRPVNSKSQTILMTQTSTEASLTAVVTASSSITVATTSSTVEDETDDVPPPQTLRKTGAERKYGKRQKAEQTDQDDIKETDDNDTASISSKKSCLSPKEDETTEIMVKGEPAEWDTKSIEDADQSISDMFHNELSVKSEPMDDDSEDDTPTYSPLSCELCAEVFTVPAAWVRHVQGHGDNSDENMPKAKTCPGSADEETVALLRCDLCQKHFLNPAEWVRHIQNTHTETELANANNSAPPKRHNRFTEGAQNKKCPNCYKDFPSHASLLIHMRTHTGERPFICGLCNKGFSVKSNLVRHLRTLHDHQETPLHEEAGPSGDIKIEP